MFVYMLCVCVSVHECIGSVHMLYFMRVYVCLYIGICVYVRVFTSVYILYVSVYAHESGAYMFTFVCLYMCVHV